MKYLFILFFSLSLFTSLFAQPDKQISDQDKNSKNVKAMQDTLGVLGFMMVNDSTAENRFAACKKFIPQLVNVLKEKNSFKIKFDRLQTVSIIYPPDSTFRIFTWQIYVDSETYHQYGAIQMNTPELKLFRLLDRPQYHPNIERQQLSSDEWIGAVYYNIQEFDSPEGKKYVLFGFDDHSFYTKQKIIDVLSFQEGKPIFGSPVFQEVSKSGSPITRHRILLKYSAETAIRCNFDQTLEMIIFDHLISQPSHFPGHEFDMLPDGSYEGFKLENGMWTHVEKVFNHKYEEDAFPVPQPVLGGDKKKKKDLFGNK